jgi:hypothetical protein
MNTNDIILASKDDAERVVESMKEVLKRYSLVSRGDLLCMVGFPMTYEDEKIGWTNLDNVAIRQVKDGYVIDLPVTEAI